jgi:hypothetical protein
LVKDAEKTHAGGDVMSLRILMLVLCGSAALLTFTGCADKTDDGDGDDGSAILMQMQQDGGQGQSLDDLDYQ